MAAKINEIIGLQSFELVRDRIGLILTEEIGNQYDLSGNEDLNLTGVWIDRSNPFDSTDTPTINVSMSSYGSEGNQKTSQSTEDLTIYNIDVYCSRESTQNKSGSILSRQQVQRILGICQVILEDSRYKTLDFPPPSLWGIKVRSIQLAPPDPEDNSNISMGRLTLEVRGAVNLKLGTAFPIDIATTRVKIEETDKGLQYIYQS